MDKSKHNIRWTFIKCGKWKKENCMWAFGLVWWLLNERIGSELIHYKVEFTNKIGSNPELKSGNDALFLTNLATSSLNQLSIYQAEIIFCVRVELLVIRYRLWLKESIEWKRGGGGALAENEWLHYVQPITSNGTSGSVLAQTFSSRSHSCVAREYYPLQKWVS